jgi:hypothetical protein
MVRLAGNATGLQEFVVLTMALIKQLVTVRINQVDQEHVLFLVRHQMLILLFQLQVCTSTSPQIISS